MVFFGFIAGIYPKKILIESAKYTCACLQSTASLYRHDYVFSLFFIPIFSWKRGKPFVQCDTCKWVTGVDRMLQTEFQPEKCMDLEKLNYTFEESNLFVCTSCGEHVNQTYKFCPHCGSRL